MKPNELTQEKLKEIVSYDPETGIFLWKERAHGRRVGVQIGSIDEGYRMIHIQGVNYYAQRLAWLYVHGAWPTRLVRFQNGDTTDCRIENLRDGRLDETQHDFRTKEGKAAHQLEYRAQRRERFNADERHRKFGVTLKEYGDMLLAQNGCCAICNQPETATRKGVLKALAIDHDHATGKVRGLLCVQCNTAIGKFKDDRNLLLSAIRYLDKHSRSEPVVTPLRAVEDSAK